MKRRIFKKTNIPLLTIVPIYITSAFVFAFSIPNKWEAALFISGVFLLICMLFVMLLPIISKEKAGWIDLASFIVTFIPFLFLLSIYITSIQIPELRETIIALSAASLGGLLTLSGVALSIKYNRIAKEEDEIKRLAPHVVVMSDVRWNCLDKNEKNYAEADIDFETSNYNDNHDADSSFRIGDFALANADLSIAILRGIFVDDMFFRFKYEIPLFKSSNTWIDFGDFIINKRDTINEINLLCEDIMQRPYLIKLGFEINKSNYGPKIKIMSAYNPVPVKDELI